MSGDWLGAFLRWAGPRQFRGKGRLITHWIRSRRAGDHRTRTFGPGLELACDLAIPYEAMVWLEYEEERDLRAMRRLLRPGDVFVDCGANVGLWSLSASPCVGPRGRVIAIEPNAASRAKLEAAISRAATPNVTVVPSAVGAQRGTVHLHRAERHNLAHVVDGAQAGTIEVAQVPLDEVLADSPVAGCKIDVEGYELRVLEGAHRAISRWRPWLCVEFNTQLDGHTRLGDWRVHRHLSGLGYRGFSAEDVLRGVSEPFADDTQFAGYANIFYLPGPANA